MGLIHQINYINHGEVNVIIHEVLQLLVNIVAMYMPHQHHMTINFYYSSKVAKFNGILLLTNFESLKIYF
jgi:hypothetical protein